MVCSIFGYMDLDLGAACCARLSALVASDDFLNPRALQNEVQNVHFNSLKAWMCKG